MRKLYTLIALLALAIGPALCGEPTEMAEKNSKKLQVGDQAPPFSLPGSDGAIHSLADHLDKRAVVIAWFPKAFTGG
jgi:peroxiredoxin Q/BCP